MLKIWKNILFIFTAMIVGFFLSILFLQGVRASQEFSKEKSPIIFSEIKNGLKYTYKSIVKIKTALAEKQNIPEEFPKINELLEKPADPYKIILGNIDDNQFTPPLTGKIIRVNLETMTVYLYEDGSMIKSLNILSKGKKNSYWETPGGEYQILQKEDNHFSSIGNVWMPYSMQFFGNFFIHGWPYYEDGTPVKQGYSGGCIRLSTEDAKIIYDWVNIGTTISIYSDSEVLPQNINDSAYFIKSKLKNPKVSAKAYLVGDVDTGEIILEKNKDEILPIASISKLMTALVSLEINNQSKTTKVSQRALGTYGENGHFSKNESVIVEDILYPLLLESSNDGAEIISEVSDRKEFIKKMNEKSQAIGLRNTSFEEPTGLSKNNKSNAYDLFKLASYIRKYKNYIFDITIKKQYQSSTNRFSYNISQFLNEEGHLGSKSGYTDEAGQTNVGIFSIPLSEFGNKNIAIVVLGSTDRYNDTKKLISYLKENVYYGQKESSKFNLFDFSNSNLKSELVMVFNGDIMLDRGVKKSVEKNFKGNYGELFKNLDFLKEADLVFANLEGPASDKGQDLHNLYSFRMNPNTIPLLKSLGFNTLSVANNHAGDWGHEAFTDTIKRLEENEILVVGGGKNKEEATKVKIFEKNGIKIGFLGFTDVGPNSLEATETDYGLVLANDLKISEIIKVASKDVDYLVTSFHFGDEYVEHNSRQEYLAHLAIESGARFVIGHHPHVVQDIEEYNGGVIAYSLGNFIFDQYFSAETMQGLSLEITVNKNEILNIKKRNIKLNSKFQIEEVTEIK